MRKSTIYAAVAFLAVVPIVTPSGAFYLAEPLAVGAAAWAFVRRGGALKMPTGPVLGLGSLLLALGAAGAMGNHGGIGYVVHEARATVVLLCAVIAVANLRRSPQFVHDVLLKGCVLLVDALVVERFTALMWDPEKLFATIDRSYRLSGPLGPGATANVLFAGAYVAITQRRWPHAGVSIVGLLFLASRAHLVALVVLYIVLVVTARLRPRQVVAATVAGAVAVALVPGGVDRLLSAAQGAERERSRLALWDTVFDSTRWADLWVGLGPGNFEWQASSTTIARQAHSQYLTAWVDLGMLGLVAIALVLGWLWFRAGRTNTRPFLVGWLVASIFGEFVFAPTVPLTLGAIPCWAVVMLGVPANTGRRRRRIVRRTHLSTVP